MLIKVSPLPFLFLLLFSFVSYPQSNRYYINNPVRDVNVSEINEHSQDFNSTQLVFEGQTRIGDYVIGPEIPVTGATGFYDYQSNGECKHYLYRYAPDNIGAIFTISTDSNNIDATRRTVYCYSTNEGNTWIFGDQIPPGLRSGFPSLTCRLTGEAVLCNHHLFGGILRGMLYDDVAPLAVTFNQVVMPYNIAWPGCAVLSNGNIMVVGSTYHNGAATDTGIVSVYNSAYFVNTSKFLAPAVIDHHNMRWTYAAGPGGKALYILDPLNDVGGNGYNRLFISNTSNSGVNWSLPMQELFIPQILQGELAVPYLGLDAIYDASGNYYVAFNTMNENRDYGSARLWVSKNGTTPVLVASHFGLNSIPEAAENMVNPQVNMCTIDNPSLSISGDGTILYIAYSVAFENDIINGFNKFHIYISSSLTSNLQFSEPVKVTNSGANSFDERYVSLAQKTPDFGGNDGKTVYMVYQKDPQSGSSSFTDLAPVSRASLIFRKISGFTYPVTGIIKNSDIPLENQLYQNYPNPFNPVTNIKFDIHSRSEVEVLIFNIEGKLISQLYKNTDAPAGKYTAEFNGNNLSSGVYFVRLIIKETGKKENYFSKKIVLIK